MVSSGYQQIFQGYHIFSAKINDEHPLLPVVGLGCDAGHIAHDGKIVGTSFDPSIACLACFDPNTTAHHFFSEEGSLPPLESEFMPLWCLSSGNRFQASREAGLDYSKPAAATVQEAQTRSSS